MMLLAIAILSLSPPVESSFLGRIGNALERVGRQTTNALHKAVKQTGGELDRLSSRVEKTIQKAAEQTVDEFDRVSSRVEKTIQKATQQTVEEHGRFMRRAHGEVGKVFPRHTALGKLVHGTVDLVDAALIITAANTIPGFQFMIRGDKCGPADKAVMNWFIPDGFKFFDGQSIDFSHACELHDRCYDNGSGKKMCDGEFGANLKNACNRVSGLAQTFCSEIVTPLYEVAVSSLGDSAYANAQTRAEL